MQSQNLCFANVCLMINDNNAAINVY